MRPESARSIIACRSSRACVTCRANTTSTTANKAGHDSVRNVALTQVAHERLVEHETWERVQELLTAKHLTGERHREHPHYLKASIFCGQCGSRLIVCYAKGR